MIILNEEQARALSVSPDPVTVINPETNESYILVRSGIYERLRLLLEDEDIALSGPELAVLVDRAMSEYDANDPALQLYQDDQVRTGES
jgi:hypothetical protein